MKKLLARRLTSMNNSRSESPKTHTRSVSRMKVSSRVTVSMITSLGTVLTLKLVGNIDYTFSLMGLNLNFAVGKPNMVTGVTGSGKISMLLALLGELTLIGGTVNTSAGSYES